MGLFSFKKDSMRTLIALPFFLFLICAVSWVVNLVKLTDCDFAAPYRCEAIHGIGLIPVAAPFTVWFDTGK